MANIIRTTAAIGNIGQFNHDWSVVKLYDTKYHSTTYELFINGEHVSSHDSVLKALVNLVDCFYE